MLNMMTNNENLFLPRVFCYFDDTIGTDVELFNDYTGERLAINEFNLNSETIKITRPYHFISLPASRARRHGLVFCGWR